MRAVWLKEFGGPEVLVAADAPEPVAGPGQVVVDVEYANITFIETQFRATGALPVGARSARAGPRASKAAPSLAPRTDFVGASLSPGAAGPGAGPFQPQLPMIPGNGVGGVVASTGDGVDPSWVGRRVVTSTGGSGGYAERAAVAAAGLLPVPDELSLEAAVALLADGRTATMLARAASPRGGDRVLVEAAAGGVGTLLVQLAAAAGATVIAAAGGERKLALARELGAEVTVDYRDPEWTVWVREAVGGLDVVFDGVGGEVGRAAFGLLDRGGRMLSYGLASGAWAGISEDEAAERGVTLIGSRRPTPEELRELTASALAEAAAGRLRPVIGQRFALDRAADAHAAIESRATVGKTLLVA